jgi:hypothetical protein
MIRLRAMIGFRAMIWFHATEDADVRSRMFSVVAAAVVSLTIAIPASARAADTFQLTINPTGSFSGQGAVIRGEAACPPGAGPAVVHLTQTVGAVAMEGFADIPVVCDGESHPWAAVGIPSNDVDERGNFLYQNGPATASIFVDYSEGTPGFLEQQVTLIGWSHEGTGPLATSTAARASVRYPTGIAVGDLLLLGCQGKKNSMNWSAPGFATVPAQGTPPVGPAGLRFELLMRWAAGNESGTTLSVTNATGVNGWSCSITAMRGGAGKGLVWYHGGAQANAANRDMVAHDQVDLEGFLITHWFASGDDNNHGQTSHGIMAFGGTAYDTAIGTDHAASMSWHVGTEPECPQGCPPTGEPFVTMRQRSNGPDAYTGATFVFSPIELEP